MCIIGLGFFVKLSSLVPSVNHAAMHGYGFLKDIFKKTIPIGMLH